MFHVEHEVDLVVGALGGEGLFGDEDEVGDAGGESEFFGELAFEGVCGGFGELDVASGEVEVVVGGVSAHQDARVVYDQGACDEFDVSWLGHARW